MRSAKVCALALASLSLVGVCLGQSVSKPAAKSPLTNRVTGFDAARAYEHVKRMVEIGPHPAGSEAIKKAQEYIIRELKSYGLKVTDDNFDARTPRGTVPMKNISAEVAGEKPGVVIIAGHYDTKLQDGFVGANDGGSSTAAVLEMARVLAKTRPEYTLWFVLFDGEEAVIEWSAMNGMDNTYGSRHMVSKLKSDGALDRVKAMILVDMIGDKNLNLKREGDSTAWLVNLMWTTAHKIGYGANYLLGEQYISDDHIPFKGAGIPVIDFIDFDYGPDHSYWHTNQDTIDKISGESMKAVGDVIITALPDLFKRLNNPPPKPARPAAQ
jgi:Zn-dependent M28 family amino/carboxypeptidase